MKILPAQAALPPALGLKQGQEPATPLKLIAKEPKAAPALFAINVILLLLLQ